MGDREFDPRRVVQEARARRDAQRNGQSSPEQGKYANNMDQAEVSAIAEVGIVPTTKPKDATQLANGQSWQEPIPFNATPEIMAFPIDVFPGPILSFVSEVSKALPCPPDYVAVPLLAIAGAAIGASRALAIKPGHVQHANIYAAVVAPPGTCKSPALELAAAPAYQESARLKREWDEKIKNHQASIERYEAEKSAARNAARKGKSSAVSVKPERPVLERVTASDATAEALGPILTENPRGIALIKDELTAWATAMNQYKAGKGSDRQFFLSCWSGAPATVDRRGQHERGPLMIPHPFLVVVGGLPPSMLPTLRGDDRKGQSQDDGWFDRILFSYPAEPRAEGESWIEVSQDAIDAWESAFLKLRSLEMMDVIKNDKPAGKRPFVLKLSFEARKVWEQFTKAHADEMNSDDFPVHLRGPWSKLRGYTGRLALIIHCLRLACGEVRNHREDVDEESMARAVKLVDYFKSHATKVYHEIGADSRVKKAIRLVDRLKDSGAKAVTRREAYRAMRGQCNSVEDIDPILELVEKHGFIRPVDAERPGAGRKPSQLFEINPLIAGHNGRNGHNSDSVHSVHSVHGAGA